MERCISAERNTCRVEAQMVEMEEEVEKARIAERFGADTITDLSMGGDIPEIRRRIFGTWRSLRLLELP
jgi:thiamine biosynthesis protein ThiC